MLRFKEEVNDLFDSGGLLLVARGQLLGARGPIFSTKGDPGVVLGWPREHHSATDEPKRATGTKQQIPRLSNLDAFWINFCIF